MMPIVPKPEDELFDVYIDNNDGTITIPPQNTYNVTCKAILLLII